MWASAAGSEKHSNWQRQGRLPFVQRGLNGLRWATRAARAFLAVMSLFPGEPAGVSALALAAVNTDFTDFTDFTDDAHAASSSLDCCPNDRTHWRQHCVCRPPSPAGGHDLPVLPDP